MASNPKIVFTGEDRASNVIKGVGRELDGLNARLSSVGAAFGGAFAAVTVGGIISSIKSVITALDDLDEISQGLGVTAVALAEMRIAAEQAGAGPERLEKALTALNIKIQEAVKGNKEASSLFEALGIKLQEVGGGARPTEQILRDISDRIKEFSNDGAKGALLAELFGQKVGPKLAAYLNQGSAGLRVFAGVTEETLEAARKLQAEIDKTSARFSAYHNSVVGDIASAANAFHDFTNQVRELGDVLVSKGAGEFLSQLDVRLGIAARSTQDLTRFTEGLSAARRVENNLTQQSAQIVLVDAEARKKAKEEAERLGKERLAAAKAAAAAAEAFLHQLDKQAEKANLNEFAALRLEAAYRGISKAAEPWIRQLEEAKNLQEAITLFVKDQERSEKSREDAFAFTRDLQERVQLQGFEADQIGRSELEQRKLAAAREIDLRVLERIRSLEDPADVQRVFDEGESAKRQTAAALEAAATKQSTLALRELLGELELETELIGQSTAKRQRAVLMRDLEKSGIDATSDAYRVQLELIDKIAGATKKNEERQQLQADIDSLSRSAAELVGEFSKTADIDSFFKNLSARMLDFTTELLVVRPLMKEFSDSLTGQANSGQAGSGSLVGLLASMFGGVVGGSQNLTGVYAQGTDSVPRTGLALVHQGERIVPAGENRRTGGGSTRSNVINVNFAGQATSATGAQVGAGIARQLAIYNRRNN